MRSLALTALSASLLLVLLFAAAGASAFSPSKPEWPDQFDAPFGLNVHLLLYFNRSAHFYYDWTSKVQRIKYHDGCLPLITRKNCDLVFNDQGTWLLSPEDDKPCCLLFKDVGAVPADFLAPFNYSSNDTAKDYYGVDHQCYMWSGADFFAYWTDAATGDDVQFRDGPTDTYWNWGPFNVVSQPSSLFALPEKCDSSCGLDEESATKTRELLRRVVRRL